jgi:VCBS repeat-containing protein
VEVTDFYSTVGASVGNVGWNYAATDAAVMTATPEAQALASDAAVSESGALLPAIAPGWLVAGGAATVAAVASGGSSSGASAVVASTTTVVSGVITAGQLVHGHGLTVQFYKKDGVTLLGTPVSVDDIGHFTATLSVGAGEAIIAKVIDASAGHDFKDEATNANKDLNAALMTVGVSNGGSLVLNINPLTTIAAQKAGLSADGTTGSVADAATATSANAAVAKAFGVADITTTTPDVTNDGAFDSTTAAGKIGAVLAAISGADLANGGNAQATIDALAVNKTTGTLTNAQQTVLAQGAAVAEAGSNVTGIVGALSSALAAQNGSTSVSINSITADNILNSTEAVADVATHTTKITGTNATGATVVLAFGSSPAVPMSGTVTALTATTWEYVVTSTDITNLGADGGQSVTATATLTGGATAVATRVFVLNAVNDAPLVAASAVGLVDTAAVDTFTEQTGTLSAVDPDAGTTPTTLTYGITGGAAGATLGGVVYDVSKAGTYGTLYVKSTTGDYVFVANATAINHVSANTTETFAVTASDGSLSGTNNLTVTITGANDTPVLVTPTAFTLTDTAAVDTFANQIGTLFASDAEGTALTYGITGSSAGATVGGIAYEVSKVGTYGTLYVKATGEYVYVANATAINALSAGVSNQAPTTETFAVTASDGSLTGVSTLTVNLTGANDTPVLLTPTAIALTDTAAVDTFANQIGTLSASDAEGSALTYGITGSSAGATVGGVVYDVSKIGTYGTLYVKSTTGDYVFVANATAINQVSANQTETFAVTASDGAQTGSNTLTVNITGANDTPVVVAPATIALVDTAAADIFTTQTGTLSASDAEGTALTFGITGSTAGATVGGVVYDVSKIGTYGTLYVKASGEYAYVVNATAVNAVSANQTETFDVTANDGAVTGSSTLTVNVTGANDRPVLASNFGVHTPPLAGDDDYVPLIIGKPVPVIVNVSDDFTDADTGHAAMTFSLLSVDGVPGATIAGVTFNSDGTVTGTPTDVVGVTYPLDYTVIVRAFDGNNSALYADHTYIVHMLKAPVAQSISVVDGTTSNTAALGKAGETLDVSVVFSEVVNVVGLPTISLSINGRPVTATYSSGSGGSDKTLHFTVAIPSGSNYDGHSISLTGVSVNTLGASVIGHDSGQSWDATPMPAAYTYYTVDNTESAAPTLTSVTEDVTAIAGVVSAGGATNDTAPTVRVTLATTGANAVVAGDTVQLYNSTTALGSVVTLSATDASNGYVDITPTGLTNGTTYTLNAKVTDAAGNVSVASGNYAVTIDTAAPVISAVAFGTTTGSLKVGDILTATITADQATYTAGAITINGKATTGFTNNGNNTYTVTYTVAQGDIDVLDTAAIPVSVVLVDTAGNSNAAYTTAPVFGSAPAVDAHVPTITSVAITATGAQNSTLNATDVITATVTFSESVTATAGSTLGILVGSATRLATVTAATGTSLTYTYTVAAGDVDADGISVPAGGFTLNAGTIKDAAGNDAALTYTAVAAQPTLKVDTAAPTITATETVAENATTVALHYTDASASLSWALAGAGVDNGKFTINSTTGVLTFTNAAPNFEAPVDSGANNVYDVTVTATDLAGNVATASPVAISVTNVNEAPTLSGSITAQHAISNAAYSYDVHSFFSDPDTGSLPATYSTLTYSATGLASGLSINATTGVISGTHTGAVAAAPVVVTATDGGGLVVSQAAFNMDVVVAPALTATQALDGVGTGLATALSVQSALVISFDSVVTLGSGHIRIYDDMGTAGWAHTNSTTLESVADSSKNDIDITIDATTHQATSVFIGGSDYSSRFNLTTSVVLDSTNHNLVIDLKQATASAAGTGVWSTAFDWDFGANYHVNFEAGIVKNLAGIGNAALDDGSATATGALQNTTINFTTVAPTNAGALSQVMDSTGATTGLVDSLYWINGNQGSNAGATPTTIDLSGKNTAVVLDSNGAASASGGLQGNVLLKNFGFDTNAWNRNGFIYMDNHGNQTLSTTDGLVAAASLASASTNLSVSNGSTVNSVRSLTDTGSVGGSSYLYIDGTGLPTASTWGSGLSSESTFELASKGAYNAIIFG